MNRRDFLKTCTIGAAASLAPNFACAPNAQPSGDPKPSILWIICEDISTDFACYNRKAVKTPNIDAFARQSLLFTNAFATAPVCSPSRSAFNTGLYQTSIDAHHHRSHRDDGYRLPAPVKLITHYFRSAGYFTCNCTEDWTSPGKTDFNFNIETPFDGQNWNQRPPGKPFFAQVNIKNFDHEGRDRDSPIDPAAVEIPPYHPDHRISRLTWAQYLERVQLLDKKVGRLLSRLEKDGLARNSIVFLFADNGRQLQRGMQYLYDDGIRVPLIVRWPGKLPAGQTSDCLVSLVDLAPTSLALACLKVPQHMQGNVFIGPDAKERSHIIAARDRCDETPDRIRCVRTKKFKYIRNFHPELPYTQPNLYKQHFYPILCLMKVLHEQNKLTPAQARFMAARKPPEELYDLPKDPHEINNLAADPAHAETLAEMRSTLENWISTTADKGQLPEPPAIAKARYENILLPRHQRVAKRRGLDPKTPPGQYLQYWQKKLTAAP